MQAIVRHLIDRPLLTNLILVFIAIASVASALQIPRLAYPRVDFERMSVTTVYPGASAEDVELNVTIKLEDAIREVDGIEQFTSKSVENVSSIQIQIDPEARDKESIKNDVRRAIDSVNDLPPEVTERPDVRESNADNWWIYEVAMVDRDGNLDRLVNQADNLRDVLQDLDSVKRVYDSGIPDREIKIALDPDRMARHYVAFDEVIAAIEQSKLRVSAGMVESYAGEKGILTFSEFEDPQDLGRIIVRARPNGEILRVADVAEIRPGFARQEQVIRFNGADGISLWVTKKHDADIIRTVAAVRDAVAAYERDVAPPQIRFTSTYDASIETRERLSIVYNNAIVGFALVLLVLFLFLDWRIAFWTSLGIPISIALTIIALPYFDITINSISLCGLVVVLGMVVDDAIIVAESIYRAMESGMPGRRAAIFGLRSVLVPVTATILTTMIAFVPMYFMTGVEGKFAVEIPSIVILMLAASLLEATTILPAHLAHSGVGRADHSRRKPWGQRLLANAESIYTQVLDRALQWRWLSALFLLAAVTAAGWYGYTQTRFVMFPLDQAYEMWLHGKTGSDRSLAFTAEQMRKVEAMIDALPEGTVHSYKTVAGRDPDGWVNASNAFFAKIILTPASQRDMSAQEVKTILLERYEQRSDPDIKHLGIHIESGGPPVGKPVEVRIIGNDNEKRRALIEQLQTELKQFHVTDMDTDMRWGKPELRLLPDYEAAARAGVSVAAIASTIRTAIDGTTVGYQHTPDEKIPYRVQLEQDPERFADPLRGLHVANAVGNLVPVRDLVETRQTRATQAYYHYNGDRTNRIRGAVDLEQTNPKATYEKLNEHYRDFRRNHPGFELEIGGEAKKSVETVNRMQLNLALTITAIFFLLTVVFNSFTQPVMVILAIPFGLVGIGTAFGLQGMDVSMFALIGILGMAGVVVNDSLIMVDLINRIRGRSLNRDEDFEQQMNGVLASLPGKDSFRKRVLAGAMSRFRPIILTTLTTVAGLFPTAYGLIGGLDAFISPMVSAMMWGLLVGTISVLFVIPVLYAVHEDVAHGARRLLPNRTHDQNDGNEHRDQ